MMLLIGVDYVLQYQRYHILQPSLLKNSLSTAADELIQHSNSCGRVRDVNDYDLHAAVTAILDSKPPFRAWRQGH